MPPDKIGRTLVGGVAGAIDPHDVDRQAAREAVPLPNATERLRSSMRGRGDILVRCRAVTVETLHGARRSARRMRSRTPAALIFMTAPIPRYDIF